MSIHTTLPEAVIASRGDRIYRVGDKYAVSKSPAAAALEFVGAENVELVPMREKYDAALSAMIENAKGEAK